jgi:flagellar hook-associated protein 2
MATPMFNVGGLSSGLDTNSIIEQLMAVERQPVADLQTKQATAQAKTNAWKKIETTLAQLRLRLNDVALPGKFDTFTEATSSDTAKVAVSAGTSVSPVNLSFTVDQLARAEQRASTTTFGQADSLVGAGTFTFSTGSEPAQTITTNASTTLTDLAQQINSLGKGVSASVVSTNGSTYQLILRSSTTGAANTINVGGNLAGLQASDFSLLQTGLDTKLTVGSGAGALTVTRPTTTITDLAPGLTLNVLATTEEPVTVTAGRSPEAAVRVMKAFVAEFNNAVTVVRDLGKIDQADKSKNGILASDASLRSISLGLAGLVSAPIEGLGGSVGYANSVGLSVQKDGTLSLDESKFRTALGSDWSSVAKLFSRSGTATDSRLQFLNASDTTKAGSHAVQITQAATAAVALGGAWVAPVADTPITFTSSGKSAEVTITAGSTLAQAVAAINAALDEAKLTSLRASDEGGALELADTRYGAVGNFTVAGAAAFGLDGSHTGLDVAGTIAGAAATGSGRTLTSATGDSSGLAVVVTATAADVAGAGGTLALGTMGVTLGWGGVVSKFLAGNEGTTGIVGLAESRWESQVTDAKNRITALNLRLVDRERNLRAQFMAMETAIANMKQMSSQLGFTATTA